MRCAPAERVLLLLGEGVGLLACMQSLFVQLTPPWSYRMLPSLLLQQCSTTVKVGRPVHSCIWQWLDALVLALCVRGCVRAQELLAQHGLVLLPSS